ncbi:MAG: TetR/AcrR family transcriptional regulator [Caulobacteraceae bacterium]|nr:TetR/AcrR family transcriptional regulator [Caulobacteraceae bacterium]
MRSKISTTDQDRRSFIEQARRGQIIECAIQAIAELGYAEVSLAKIARRAQISTGVISYYFAGKEDLIREVMTHVYATGDAFVRPRVEGKAPARDALLAFIEASVGFVAAYPQYLTAMVEIIASRRAARVVSPQDQAMGDIRRDALTRILQSGQASGEFRAFRVSVMTDVIIEAIDLAAIRDVEPGPFAKDLVDLFDHATRAPAEAAPGITGAA